MIGRGVTMELVVSTDIGGNTVDDAGGISILALDYIRRIAGGVESEDFGGYKICKVAQNQQEGNRVSRRHVLS